MNESGSRVPARAMRAATSAFSSGCQRAGSPHPMPARFRARLTSAIARRERREAAGDPPTVVATRPRAACAACRGGCAALASDLFRHLLALGLQLRAQPVVLEGEDGDGQVARVLGAHRSHADRGHGHAGWHLHGGQQGVEAAEGRAVEGHPDHGQRRMRGHGPGQVRGPARARDDHAQAALGRFARIGGRLLRAAVRGEDADVVRDLVVLEDARALGHRGQVAVAAHQDRDDGGRSGHGGVSAARAGARAPSGRCPCGSASLRTRSSSPPA